MAAVQPAVGVMLVQQHPMSAVLGGVVLVEVVTPFTALWVADAVERPAPVTAVGIGQRR